MRVVVIHGPSLSLLGRREPDVYGAQTLHQVNAALKDEAAVLGIDLHVLQTNHEGAIIDTLLACDFDGAIVNAGAYAHSSLAIADAVRAIAPVPVIEVHLTNTAARAARGETERAGTVVGAACLARIEGLGPLGYGLALRALHAGALAGAARHA